MWLLALVGCGTELAFEYDQYFWETDAAFTACKMSYFPTGGVRDTATTTESVTATGDAVLFPPAPYFGIRCVVDQCQCFRDQTAIADFTDAEMCQFIDDWIVADVPSSEARITKRIAEHCPF